MNDEDHKTFFNEIRNLKDLDHPGIVKIYDFFSDKKRFYIIIDICKGGELFDHIVTNHHLTEQDTSLLIKQLLSCIHYCHSKKLMHRDIKPENILLDSVNQLDQIKIVNFGSSIRFTENNFMTEKIGTPYYIAPEVLNKKYGPKCDVWSIGVITFICLFGKAPFDGINDQEIMKCVKKGKFSLRQPITVSDEAKDFILFLLNPDQSLRPSVKDALSHPWLKLGQQHQSSSIK